MAVSKSAGNKKPFYRCGSASRRLSLCISACISALRLNAKDKSFQRVILYFLLHYICDCYCDKFADSDFTLKKRDGFID